MSKSEAGIFTAPLLISSALGLVVEPSPAHAVCGDRPFKVALALPAFKFVQVERLVASFDVLPFPSTFLASKAASRFFVATTGISTLAPNTLSGPLPPAWELPLPPELLAPGPLPPLLLPPACPETLVSSGGFCRVTLSVIAVSKEETARYRSLVFEF